MYSHVWVAEWAKEKIMTKDEAILMEVISNKYTIEKHGNGYALYYGRDMNHHGLNLAHITETTEATIKMLERALELAQELRDKNHE